MQGKPTLSVSGLILCVKEGAFHWEASLVLDFQPVLEEVQDVVQGVTCPKHFRLMRSDGSSSIRNMERSWGVASEKTWEGWMRVDDLGVETPASLLNEAY